VTRAAAMVSAARTPIGRGGMGTVGLIEVL
jgi:hypothetical protein